MKKFIIVVITILVLTISNYKEETTYQIPTDSIRMRVISSSDDELDVKTKLELKSYLEKELYNLLKDVETLEETKEIIVNNLEDINIKIEEFLGNTNYKLDYGLNYFPKKIYKGTVYQEGIYESLVVTLGDGKGKNWWCTLFPPLCLLENNETTTDVEYKLFISSIINKTK